MAEPDRAAWLRQKLDAQIKSFQDRRDRNRTFAFWFRTFAVGLAALTTVLVGLQSKNVVVLSPEQLSAAALVVSASLAVLTAWENFFDYRWLWLRYTATLGELYALKDELEYCTVSGSPAGVAATETVLDDIFRRLQVVLSETNMSWGAQRTKGAAK